MDVKNVDVVKSLNDMIWKFCLSTELWEIFIGDKHIIDFTNMKKIPFLMVTLLNFRMK